MPKYSEKKKQMRDELMHSEVYREASAIVASEGISALTMDRIAAGVGVSRGTLYNYFADRDTVLDYVEERAFGPILEALEEIADSDETPEDKLIAMATWIFTALHRDRSLFIALLPNKHNALKKEEKARRHEKALAPIAGVIEQGISDGTLRQCPPAVMSQYFFNTLAGTIDSMLFVGETRPADEVVPPLMDLLLGGLSVKR